MNKTKLGIVTNLVTGHNMLGSHMVILRISNNNTCRWCRKTVEDGITALSNRRLNIYDPIFLLEFKRHQRKKTHGLY